MKKKTWVHTQEKKKAYRAKKKSSVKKKTWVHTQEKKCAKASVPGIEIM